MMKTLSPFSRPMYVMVKPVGASCNLACKYCYYLEKSHLYANDARHILSDELLEKFIREYIESQTMEQVLFTWHGGEPLMRPLSFYEKVMRLEEKYARGRQIDNAIQTNGTLINDQWAEFFHQNGWLVGVSIDGPQRFHDAYRKSRLGRPSFREVMHGINLLNRHGAEWNAMATVNRLNGDFPLEFYHFFKDIGCQYLQFTPVVERITSHADGRHLASATDAEEGKLADFSVTPQQWGQFTCSIFDEWVRNDVAQCYIQLFDATLANWAGVTPGVCSLAQTCGHAGVMEYNGDVYCCDHFVFPEYKLGNLREKTLVEMMYGEREEAFGKAKSDCLPSPCKNCPWLFACHGECPKNRFCKTETGEGGLNYLCEGYRQFFAHVAPYMDYMKKQLDRKEAPAQIMDVLRKGTL